MEAHNQATIVQQQVCMEMQFTRRLRATAEALHGTVTTRASLTRAVRSSSVEAIAAIPPVLVCSISATTMAIATATTVSALSSSHFSDLAK